MAKDASTQLLVDLHLKFILSQDEQKDELRYWMSQHLKMNGVFWGLSAMELLGQLDKIKREDVIAFVVGCWNTDGGFGGNVGQDSHMLYTLSAVQVLCLFDALDTIDKERCARWVASMQLPDGSFQGDEWGEVDTRFVYIAMNCLQLLGSLHLIDLDAAVRWVLQCQNWDGGFGVTPGAESHAGQIFCCIGALSIANALHCIDKEQLSSWLAMRQLPSGGLNGRPEKKADVCYSWWVVSSLSMLGHADWIDRKALFNFILACQDAEDGGISDKPGNMADVYHTFYGLCGLALLGYEDHPLNEINPVYAMPYSVLERLGVPEERGLPLSSWEMRRAVLAGPLVCLSLALQKPPRQQYRFGSSKSKESPGLVDHCKLVHKIQMGQQPDHVRRKRIQGVVRKMETNYMQWLTECGPKESALVLETLAGVSRYLKRDRPARVSIQQREEEEWTGASPYFSPGVNDWLCVLLQRAARHASRSDECMTLLRAAAELELADTETLQHLCRQLTNEEYTSSATPGELVCVLQMVSLLVKRCRMPVPHIDHLLCRLPSASLDSRQSLNVLSAMLRLRERHSIEVVRSVSRRAVEHVESYTPRDVIYALEAIALLNCCHESYAGAVLNRCIALHTELKPTELGSVCKYVAMLNGSRTNNDTALCCSKELRRLLPALLSRAEQLLGRFSLRDARCVLSCLQQHKVHHSVVFSRLTPLASEN